MLVFRFTKFGKCLDILHIDSDSVGNDDTSAWTEVCSPIAQMICERRLWEHLKCLLITPCEAHCIHRSTEQLEYALDNGVSSWLIELLSMTLRLGGTLERCRAVTLLGQIGGDQAEYELSRCVGDKDDDVRWAAVAALKGLGRGDLLSDWNYR